MASAEQRSGSAPSSVDATQLRGALACFAIGVTIVTARTADGSATGVTATSFNSVSLDPPLVLWSIGRHSSTYGAFTAAPHWAVHVLTVAQQPLAKRFAQHGIDRFAGVAIEPGLHGLPLLAGSAACFECRAVSHHLAGDHSILIGEVLRVTRTAATPLLFHASRFAALES
jgi:3-hydroxy-9,10-secoandrosta-1,3,5(10)-triene-9,17-dione monooxygenase reductase component